MRLITTHTAEIQKTVRKHYKKLYAKKLDNLEEMDNFLETYNFPKLNQEKMENLKTPIISTDVELVINKNSQ